MIEKPVADRRFVIIVASAFLAKLWLTSQTRIIAAYAPHDALNYLWHAKSLAMGLWFGPYDQFTLIKQPFFAFYMAALQEFGIPLTTAHVIFYGFACFVACLAVKPLVRNPTLLGAMFVVLYFNPMENEVTSWSSTRAQINGSLALLTLACAIGLFVRRGEARASAWSWSVALGASLAAFWLTREEAVWVVPALLVFLAAFLTPVIRKARWAELRTRLIVSILPVAMCVAAVAAIMVGNGLAYGWYTTAENLSPELVGAYNALARIDPGVATDRRFPVPHAARVIAYRVSPTARILAPSLDGANGAAWGRFGCQQFNACGDIHSGWFVWAFRNAVSDAGYYSSGSKARAFYLRLSEEIDAACAARTIVCRSKGRSLSPPLYLSDVPHVATDTIAGIQIVSGFTQFSVLPPYYVGPPSVRPDYDFIVRSVDDGFGAEPAAKDDDFKRAVLVEIAHTYQTLFPWWSALAIIAAIARLAALRWSTIERRYTDYIVATLGFGAGILSLLLVLSLVDTLSFPTFTAEYMAPLFPLLIALVALVSAMEASTVARFINDRLPAHKGSTERT